MATSGSRREYTRTPDPVLRRSAGGTVKGEKQMSNEQKKEFVMVANSRNTVPTGRQVIGPPMPLRPAESKGGATPAAQRPHSSGR